MSSPEEIARFNGLTETFRASVAALEKDFAIGQRALLERALKAEADSAFWQEENVKSCGHGATIAAENERLKAWNQERAGQFAATEQRLATEVATLRGIIARSTLQRLSDSGTFYITFDDVNTCLEIAAAYKEQTKEP